MGDFARLGDRPRQLDLLGKVVVVTGASRGIGQAIAINLANRGCNILGTSSSAETAKLIYELETDIQAVLNSAHPASFSKIKIIGQAAGIASPDCVDIIVSSLQELFDDKVDILMNNAAITGGTKIGHTIPDLVQKMLFANLQTPIMLVDELVKRKMFRPESRIINMSSDRAQATSAESLIYSATKSGLESLARTWAKALGGNSEEYAFMAGNTANSISVGITETDIVKRFPAEAMKERLKEELAIQFVVPGCKAWFAEAEDIADVVGMLCSREGRWITGSVIPATGGAATIL